MSELLFEASEQLRDAGEIPGGPDVLKLRAKGGPLLRAMFPQLPLSLAEAATLGIVITICHPTIAHQPNAHFWRSGGLDFGSKWSCPG